MSVESLDDFQKRIAALGAGGLIRSLKNAMTTTMMDAETYAKVNATTRPKVRTGNLRQSIRSSVKMDSGGITGELEAGRGTRHAYAAMQEFGKKGHSKSGGFLRIPIKGGPALTAAGVDRYPSPLKSTAPGEFFVIKGPKGMVLKRTDDPDGDAWYALVKSVNIPATKFMSRGLNKAFKEMEPLIQSMVTKKIMGEKI